MAITKCEQLLSGTEFVCQVEQDIKGSGNYFVDAYGEGSCANTELPIRQSGIVDVLAIPTMADTYHAPALEYIRKIDLDALRDAKNAVDLHNTIIKGYKEIYNGPLNELGLPKFESEMKELIKGGLLDLKKL